MASSIPPVPTSGGEFEMLGKKAGFNRGGQTALHFKP